MTPEQFCYWLQGKCELDPRLPTEDQWKSIREHLKTVFVKVTPPLTDNQTQIKYYLDGAKEWPPNTVFC